MRWLESKPRPIRLVIGIAIIAVLILMMEGCSRSVVNYLS